MTVFHTFSPRLMLIIKFLYNLVCKHWRIFLQFIWTSLDCRVQTGNATVGDWQEEVFQKVRCFACCPYNYTDAKLPWIVIFILVLLSFLSSAGNLTKARFSGHFCWCIKQKNLDWCMSERLRNPKMLWYYYAVTKHAAATMFLIIFDLLNLICRSKSWRKCTCPS